LIDVDNRIPNVRLTGFLRIKPLTLSTSSLSVALTRHPCTPNLGTQPLAGSMILVRSSLWPYDSSRSASSMARKESWERSTDLACRRDSRREGVEMMTSGLSLRRTLKLGQ
jgi:hypothetical protein